MRDHRSRMYCGTCNLLLKSRMHGKEASMSIAIGAPLFLLLIVQGLGSHTTKNHARSEKKSRFMLVTTVHDHYINHIAQCKIKEFS